MIEIWSDIIGYEGSYKVSNLGNVMSMNYNHTGKSKIMTLGKHPQGYKTINLYKNSSRKTFLVHRLVASSFLNLICNNLEVNHKDGNKSNNEVSNLELVTPKDNVLHSYKTGLKTPSYGGVRKLTYEIAEEIREKYSKGVRHTDLMREYGLSSGYVSQICNKQRWAKPKPSVKARKEVKP